MNDFKIGDRVQMTTPNTGVEYGDIGTVKIVSEEIVGVDWDNFRRGHDGTGLYKGRKGHCWNVFEDDIELISRSK